ncbi:MAG: hypothetical protein AAF703_18740 [Cyanobacteria bacterium P01_D01_bin.105]
MRGAIAWSTFPLAYLVAGPLAEHVFQPLLTDTGVLSLSLGPMLGVGEGRGIGLLFVAVGIFIMAVTLAASYYPRIRFVEDELPDTVPDA